MVYLVSGNTDKPSINFEPIFTPLQHHKSYLFTATYVHTKRTPQHTRCRNEFSRKKKWHDRVACSEMNQAACLLNMAGVMSLC